MSNMSKVAAGAAAVTGMVMAPLAMAAGEAAQITSVFDEYKAEAIIVIVAFAVVLWTLKGVGLLKRGG